MTRVQKLFLRPSALWMFFAFCIFSFWSTKTNAQVGTWTALTRQAPDANNGVMILLTDGRVMCHSTAGGSLGDGTIWDILTPDSTGSYVNGTWSQSAAMTQERYSFSSALLNNGKVYAGGGEYGTDGTQAGWHVEIYDPVANTWTEATGTSSAKTISDGNCQILDNGNVLQALVDVSMPVHTNFYNPTTNAMTSAPSTLNGQNESMWLKLPDNSILMVDEGATSSERYIPSQNQWIADGTVPVALYDPNGFECGPGWMLPNGKAFFVGGTNTAVLYTPSGTTAPGTWATAATPPTVGGLGYGMPDAPGAMMPNGKILLAMSPQPTASNEFNSPTAFFEYNYLTNSYASVPVPSSAASSAISQQYNMLVLPTGQVMLGMDQDNSSAQYYVYNPTGTPLDTGKPVINQIIPLTCTKYMAIGHRFNGISSGAAFGDENENDENYPLFRLQTGNRVYYARSYNWNSRGVQRGLTKIDTAYFDLPASIPTGTYNLYAVTNGIPSNAYVFNSGIASLNSPVSNSICSGATFTYTPTSSTPGATFSWTRPAVTGISNAAITTAQTTNPNETLTNTTTSPITVNYVYSVTGGGCSNIENVAVVVNPKPAASFTATPTSSCILPDSVTFTNTTIAGTTYVWTFGDGGATSTATNPVHAYTAPGSFSVKLTANSACGADSVTVSNFIAVTAPAGPAVASVTPHCGSTTFTLTANTPNNVAWYNAAGTFLSSANPYTTPLLTSTQTFYVDDSVPAAFDSVGPATYTTLGAGGIFTGTNQHYLTFDALSDFTLVSVVVDASTAGARTIQLINSGGTVIATASPTIPVGVSTVPLNFSVPRGTGYEMSCSGTVNLYRNNAVPAGSYPFTKANIVSITGNDVGTGYYYYFYDWKVRGAPCISARTAVTATVNPAVTAAAHTQSVACYGGATGADTAIVTGGTQTFSYSWSNSQSGRIVTGLSAGTYTVTVTDANQCTATATSVITQPAAALSVSGTITNPTCANPNSGKVVLTVSGGTSSYSYLWSTTPAQSRDTATSLTGGSYTVTVTDAHSCTSTASYTVTAPVSGITLSTSSVNATCGNANGTASVSVTSGTGSYIYAWSGGGSTTATNANVAAGTYTVTVTSSVGGCSATASVQVSSTGGPTLTPAFANTTCGLSNGSAHVVPTGGTAPFTYAWSNAATDSAITGLAAGTYTVTATDFHGCASISSVTIAGSSAVGLTTSATATSCGLNNGSASVSVANPSSPTYSWSNSGTGGSISGLASGTYTVTVTNGGCSATATASVAASSPVTFISSSTATTCGLNNGAATVSSVTNPINPTYLWSNNATSASLTGLAAGGYTVTVTNGGCTASSAVSISPSTGTSFTTSTTPTTCGNSNGTASASLTSIPNNTTYLWSNNVNTASITGVPAGSYTLTVTNNGCSATATVSVAASTGTTFTTSSTATTCGSNNGSATATLTDTPNNVSYLWSNNAATSAITGLASGNYNVTVTNNGCSASAIVTVGGSNAPTLNSSAVATTCGNNNGIAIANEVNPNSPTYTWSNNATTDTVTGLAPGTYTVTVNDGGCTASASIVVGSSQGPVFTVSSSPTTCGQNNGTATANLFDPHNNLSYHWSNNATTATTAGLAAGTYTVTLTNGGCSGVSSVVVTSSSGPTLSTTATPTSCGNSNGTATVTVTNVANPTYAWSNSDNTSTISNVAGGVYTVTVTDGGTCSATATVTVPSSNPLTLNTTSTTTTCGANNGSATVIANNAVNPTYSWSNSGTTSTINNLAAGNYTVTVNDGNCSATANVSISIGTNTSFALTVDKSHLCFGDSAHLCAVSGFTSYQWSNSATGVCIYVTQSGTYTVTASNAGCTATSTPTSITAYAANPATYTAVGATLTSAGGTSYQWYLNGNPISGATTQVWTATTSGNYSVEITDANGCSTTSSSSFVIATGIVNVSSEVDFSIYPNPAKSSVTVQIPNLSSEATVSLRDILGQHLTTVPVTSSQMSMDLTPYVDGVYFVEVAQGGKRAIRKLIINR